jgi:hypothetical protein
VADKPPGEARRLAEMLTLQAIYRCLTSLSEV